MGLSRLARSLRAFRATWLEEIVLLLEIGGVIFVAAVVVALWLALRRSGLDS